MPRASARRIATYALAMGLALVPALALAAWQGPPGAPTSCPAGYQGCSPTLDQSGSNQTKTGALIVQGNLTAVTQNITSTLDMGGVGQICLGGTCKSSWSAVGPWAISGNNIYNNNTGNVGVGTASVGYKLTVGNGAIGGNYGLTPTYAAWAAYGTGDGGAAIYNDSGTYKTLMIVGNSSAGGARNVGVWDNLNVNGAITQTGTPVCLQNGTNCPAAAATPNLQAVTNAGNSTTQGITVNGLTTNNNLDVTSNGGAWSAITMHDDESPGGYKVIHANSNVIGFLGGNWTPWLSYWDNAGNQMLTGNLNAGGSINGTNINQDVRTNSTPQFSRIYDDNTAFYVDSNTTSHMSSINLDGSLNAGGTVYSNNQPVCQQNNVNCPAPQNLSNYIQYNTWSGDSGNDYYGSNGDIHMNYSNQWLSSVLGWNGSSYNLVRNDGGNYSIHASNVLINGATWAGSFNWSGQGGQPTWLWGSNDGANMYVWNPSNFSVANATRANGGNNNFNINGGGNNFYDNGDWLHIGGSKVTVDGTLNLAGPMNCINNICPPAGAIRLTPNFHLNSNQGNAVIVNWDNGGVGAGTQEFRVGNGAGSDMFQVLADGTAIVAGNLTAGGSSVCRQNGVNCPSGGGGTGGTYYTRSDETNGSKGDAVVGCDYPAHIEGIQSWTWGSSTQCGNGSRSCIHHTIWCRY